MDVMEVLQNLTDDQKNTYMALETMFGSDGWQRIKKWADEQKEVALNRATFAQTWEANRVAVGEASVYAIFADLNDSMLNQFAELARQNSEARAEQELSEEGDFE